MKVIIASAARRGDIVSVFGVVALALLTCNARAAGDATPGDEVSGATHSTLPVDYALSYDRDKWTEEFSVFHLAVADRVGTLASEIAASDDPRLRPLTRLDSTWNIATPLTPLPTRIGDSISSVGFWDQPARMGGIQIGSLQPQTPAVTAPPGIVVSPYEIVGPFAQTGGRFIDYLHAQVQVEKLALAAPGQGAFSVESGRLRENFELRSNDYGPWMTSGTYRYGLTASTTLDGQVADVQGQQSFLGVGVLEGLGPLGLVSARLASSRDSDSAGWLARMGYDYSHDRVSIALRSHIQSPGFQAVGDTAYTETFRQRTLAIAGVDLGSLGKISVASASQTYVDDSRRDIVAVSHAMPIRGGGVLSAAAAYSPGQAGNSALLLSFTYPFDFIAPPARRLSATVDSALDRTVVDAFGQTRVPATGRIQTDRPIQP